MLWAIGQPAAFAGLVVAFLLGVGLRAVAIRLTARALSLAPRREPVAPRPREDIDPFGAVAAALGGTGWGRTLEVDAVPRHRGRAGAAAVFGAGPLAAFAAAQVAFAVYGAVFPDHSVALALYRPSDVLRGVLVPAFGAQLMISIAAGLLGFALLSLIPLPPLDGFGLLWSVMRHPGPGVQRAKLWLADNNVGIALLLVFLIFPFGRPLVLVLIDLVGTPLMRMWA